MIRESIRSILEWILNKAIPSSPNTDSIYERLKTLDDNYTSTRAAKLDNLDKAIPTSPTSDSIFERLKTLDDNYTSTRAAKLDNLDAAVSSRASPDDVDTKVHNRLNTAVPTSPTGDSIYERIKTLDDNYTSARAAKLDKLDANISSRAAPGSFSEVADQQLAAGAAYNIAANGLYTKISDSVSVGVEFYCDADSSWVNCSEMGFTFVGLSTNTRIHNSDSSSHSFVLRKFVI